jgi:cytidylate kinase
MDPNDRGPVQLITVSREYGAGGSELGVLLGEHLGWRVLDRDLARRIAGRLRCADRTIETMVERAPTLLERVTAAFTVVPAEAPILPDPSAALDPDHLVEASRAVLREAVRELPLIIIGHAANCLFGDRPDVLRIRVTAPYDLRVRRVAQRSGVSPAAAADDVRHHDDNRRQYLERYYRCDTNDPGAYDLQINTATIPLNTAADLVRGIVNVRNRS